MYFVIILRRFFSVKRSRPLIWIFSAHRIQGGLQLNVHIAVRDLIGHAVRTTAFYSKFPEDVELKDLPVVNKDTWRGDYDAFISSA